MVPTGITVDSSGNIYVADTGNNRIQIFNSEGSVISLIGSQGSSDGQFNNPCDVAVDSSGKLYVTDYGNSFVYIFK